MDTLRNTVSELTASITDLLFCKKITPEVGQLIVSKIMEFTPFLDKYEPIKDSKFVQVRDLYKKEMDDFETTVSR